MKKMKQFLTLSLFLFINSSIAFANFVDPNSDSEVMQVLSRMRLISFICFMVCTIYWLICKLLKRKNGNIFKLLYFFTFMFWIGPNILTWIMW